MGQEHTMAYANTLPAAEKLRISLVKLEVLHNTDDPDVAIDALPDK